MKDLRRRNSNTKFLNSLLRLESGAGERLISVPDVKMIGNNFDFFPRVRLLFPLISCFLAVLFGALYSAPPVHAQGLGGLRGAVQNLSRPVVENVRTVIRPTLGIVRDRTGSVTGLHLSDDQSFLFSLLDDGTFRLWDLRHGMQLGGSLGGSVISGSFRDAERITGTVGIRRDGSLILSKADGSVSQLSGRIQDFDSSVAPVVSRKNLAVVYRSRAGNWYWRHGNAGVAERLRDAAREVRPILSEDGSKIVYQTAQGRLIRKGKDGGVLQTIEFDGCSENKAQVTAGAFTPDGELIVLGDREGNLCALRFSGPADFKEVFTERKIYPSAILLLSIGRDGRRVAFGGNLPRVSVASLDAKARRPTSVETGVDSPRSIVLDSKREWVFLGSRNGVISVYSLKEKTRLARLISTKKGWAVIDEKERFDGTQSGFNALVWAGETESETLPVEAFSDSYFEPGLLARLDDSVPNYLNEEIRDLSEDGYYPPPVVSIDPLRRQDISVQGSLQVKIRVSPEYTGEVNEIRLYHNGKLVPSDRSAPSQNNKIFEYSIRVLLPGKNVFKAIGTGHGNIESRPALASITFDAPKRRRAKMQVVSVGIQDYGPKKMMLFETHSDAKKVAETLQKLGKGLFLNVNTKVLLDSFASMTEIERHIVQNSASQEDVLVVLLAGHGKVLEEKEGWEWYFLPHTPAWLSEGAFEELAKKSPIPSNRLKVLLRENALSGRKLMDFVTKAKQQRVFLILDSCYSGAIVDAVSSTGAQFNDSAARKVFHRISQIGGIHVLAATRADELAAELKEYGHGALAYLVLQGMKGAADDNKDSEVSIHELIRYSEKEMPLLLQRLNEKNPQNPISHRGDFDFSIVISDRI